jgi:hypothetical protein
LDSVNTIRINRDSNNKGLEEEIPSCRPLRVAAQKPSDFLGLVLLHKKRLLASGKSEDDLEDIVKEKKALAKCVLDERRKKELVEVQERDFEESWGPVKEEFVKLFEFCGGLASIFPGTACVESDFSIIGYENDDNRRQLSYFALEGVLHAKQAQRMSSVGKYDEYSKLFYKVVARN